MKRVLSMIVAMVIVFSAVPSMAAESVAVEASMKSELCFGEMAKVSCTITNSASPMGASAKLYLDGSYITGSGSDYFVLYGQNTESFEFCVPASLDPQYSHTLLLEIVCDNGQAIYKPCVFTVKDTPWIQTSFFSTPLYVNKGCELYFGIQFSVPDNCAYRLYGAAYVRGVNIPETNQELTVRNGDRIYVCVPAGYNAADTADFSFSYIVGAGYDNKGFEPRTITFAGSGVVTDGSDLKAIEALVIPATVNYRVNGYSYASLTGYVTTIEAGTIVEYMNPDNHNSMRAAKVKLASGTVCWVSMSAITVSTKNYTIKDILTNEDREAFVNRMGYSSKTDYLIWVNKQRQRLTLFMGSKGNWKVVNVFPVATGKNLTPTPTTVCEYKYKTRWVTPGYTCDPVMSLYDGYAIHNQPVSPSGYVIDTTIGNPASAGCVRMLIQDVRTLCYYTPVGTTVVLY